MLMMTILAMLVLNFAVALDFRGKARGKAKWDIVQTAAM
jgi:hypothetical protein